MPLEEAAGHGPCERRRVTAGRIPWARQGPEAGVGGVGSPPVSPAERELPRRAWPHLLALPPAWPVVPCAMRIRSWLPGAVLCVLIAVVAVGLLLTRERVIPLPPDQPREAGAPQLQGERIMDMPLLLTARRVAVLAHTPEEQELARQARRLAEHAVDLAFAESIRRIAEEAPEPTPENPYPHGGARPSSGRGDG